MAEPAIFATEEAMLDGASEGEPLGGGDGKSGASLFRLQIDDQPRVLKRTTLRHDWTMRATGDTVFRPFLIWRRGIMHRAPSCIDHATVAMAFEADTPIGPRLSILMHDIGASIVPEGDQPVGLDQHLGFIDHMAALAATFWDFDEDADLCSMLQRVRFFCPENMEAEHARPDHSGVIDVAVEGWRLLPDRAPALAEVVTRLHHDPSPLLTPLRSTPQTFLHGDWKMGNLGTHPDGRTVLLDWAYPGRGPATLELAWYLALNADRLPQTKDAAIAAYRAALERQGIETDGWWERQLGLSLVAIMVMFGWEKAVSDPAELAWWDERVNRERRWLA